MKKILGIVAILTLFLAACGSENSYETIEIDTIPQKIEEGYQVLDVREPSEYDMGHIVGAENKPLSELKAGNFDGLNAKEKYVVICQSGNRSREASTILNEEKYSILNVSKGMSSWTGEIE
ncbi:MAG: rhodanese-like domain-containing protein [Paenisporosarcina sp.]|nr:rhodanese-like domain-containing protein [Paenisporosarcina sp.]